MFDGGHNNMIGTRLLERGGGPSDNRQIVRFSSAQDEVYLSAIGTDRLGYPLPGFFQAGGRTPPPRVGARRVSEVSLENRKHRVTHLIAKGCRSRVVEVDRSHVLQLGEVIE